MVVMVRTRNDGRLLRPGGEGIDHGARDRRSQLAKLYRGGRSQLKKRKEKEKKKAAAWRELEKMANRLVTWGVPCLEAIASPRLVVPKKVYEVKVRAQHRHTHTHDRLD
jgi:hypothetical protein